MANNTINFTINLEGNAYTGIVQIDEALGNVLVSAKNTKSFFEHLKTSAFNFDVITNAIGKVSQAFGTLVGSSLDFEQQQANLKTLLNGDAEATEGLVNQIREYSKATVYDNGSLIEAQKTMMAFGIEAEHAFGKLKNIGDIALGDKQKMQSLALAFSQMSSTGKLLGQDYNQMVNAGFNPLLIISEKTGKSLATLKEEMGKGKITVKQVEEAFEAATAEGGLFFKGAETAAETTAGKIAKVKGEIEDLKMKLFEATGGATAWIAEIGNMVIPISQMYPLAAGAFKGIKNGAGWAKTKISELSLATKSSGGFFSLLKIKGVTALNAIKVGISSIPIVGWIAIAVTAITAFTVWLYTKFESVRNWLDGIGSFVMALSGPFGVLINIVTSFIKHWESVKQAFTAGGIIAGLKRIGFVIIDAMLKPVQALLELLSKIPGLGKLAEKGSKWIGDMRNNLDEKTKVEVLEPEAAGTKVEDAKKKTTAGTLGNTAGTVAGKAQQIHITLGNMVGTMNFNGNLRENASDVERQLTEMMARILGMAETAA